MSASLAEKHTRVTVLSGFLGAGKTTVLNRLLAQAKGRRWAAVVNDVAAINIDADVVKLSDTLQARDVVSLGNGCVCCSSRDELGETIAELALSGNYEHIWVETSGVAEPRGVAALFGRKNLFGQSLADFADLSALVGVVDAAAFLRAWRARPARRSVSGAGEKPYFELVIEQAECVDLLLLNKTDLVSETERAEVTAILSGLNARAEIVPILRGDVSAELVAGRLRYDAATTPSAATWIRAMNALAPGAAIQKPGGASPLPVKPRHEAHYGITSMTFQARRPFRRAALEGVLRDNAPELLRAKGFFWIAEQPDEIGFLSLAGGVVRYEFLQPWWAALIEMGRAGLAERPPMVQSLWQEPHGDRRQELVFIGVKLNELALRQALEDALV